MKILEKSQSVRSPTQCKSGLGNNMVCRRNYSTFFNNNSPPLCQFLCKKILLKKVSYRKRMLIEQIFELREPGPPGRICTFITVCFHDNTIISKENLRLDCNSLLKFCRRHCTSLPPTWAKSLRKFNPKMQDF